MEDILDTNGNPPVFTWCLRVDYQIKKIHGRYDYILTEHKDFLTHLEQQGDELGRRHYFWDDDKGQDRPIINDDIGRRLIRWYFEDQNQFNTIG